MPSLHERLFGEGTRPKIPIDPFYALLCQFGRNALTRAQVRDAVSQISAGDDAVGVGLNQLERTELDDLADLIDAASGRAGKLDVQLKIRDCLTLAESRCVLTTPQLLRDAIGVQTRT